MKQSLFVFRIRVLMRPTTGGGTDAYGKSSHSRPPCSKISNIASTIYCYRVLPRHRIALMSSLTRANKAVMLLRLAIGLVFLAFVSVASAVERDVVIVLDNSRSMERFDAAGLVRSAVSRSLYELNGNAQAALVLTSDTPAVAIPLIPLTVKAHARFRNALQQLTYRGNYSDIALALQQAVHELVYSGGEKIEKSILLIVGALNDPRDLAAVQFRLHVLGYQVGYIDGVIGPKTRGAIREFQRDHRLAVDGQLSRGLLARLGGAYAERWPAELSAKATRAGITIVAGALGGESILSRRLAEKTSGEYFQVANVEALPQVFERLKGTFTRAAEAPLSVPPESAALPAPEAEAPGVKPPRKDVLTEVWMWIGFTLLILLLLILDLVVFHRKAHVIKVGEALVLSGVWIGLALLFNVFIYFIYEYHGFGLDIAEDEPDGRTAAVLFFTGYVVEKSLSVDNLFVIAMIFSYFGVPPQYQHRVLFWGIFGALLMRAVLILVGVVLVERFHWILYLFGAFLIFTAAKMLLDRHERDPRDNRLVQLTKRLFPITENYVGQRFTVRMDGKLMFTPLVLALIGVESADLMFAVDSIPAIFAITDDPFILFSSNAFAILGLRSLYFALAGIMDKFHYLRLSLALLLALVGVKMLLKDVLHTVPNITYYTLGAIALILTGGVVASLIRAQRMANKDEPEGPQECREIPAETKHRGWDPDTARMTTRVLSRAVLVLWREWPLLMNLATTALFFRFDRNWLADLTDPAWFALMLAWFFTVILFSAFAVVRHAESLAVKLGEPLGTLVLTLSVTGIEVMIISAVMLTGGGSAVLARDAMFAVVMIVLNGMVGLSLLLGGLRYHKQTYNLLGANAFLAVMVPLAVLGLVLPSFTVSSPGPTFSPLQAIFLIIMSAGLYGVFLAIQNVRHRDYFMLPNSGEAVAEHHGVENHGLEIRSVGHHVTLLLAYLLPLVILSKQIAVPIDYGIRVFHAPAALGGLLVAVLILSPESLAATLARRQFFK